MISTLTKPEATRVRNLLSKQSETILNPGETLTLKRLRQKRQRPDTLVSTSAGREPTSIPHVIPDIGPRYAQTATALR